MVLQITVKHSGLKIPSHISWNGASSCRQLFNHVLLLFNSLDGSSKKAKSISAAADGTPVHSGHTPSHSSPQATHGTSQQAPQTPTSTQPATATAATGQYAPPNYGQTGGYSQQPAAQASYQGGQYPPTGPQQPPAPYSQPPYNQQYGQSSDPNYANYQNWGYSQTGYGSYNQGWGNYNYY